MKDIKEKNRCEAGLAFSFTPHVQILLTALPVPMTCLAYYPCLPHVAVAPKKILKPFASNQ